jgi:outer membrane protein assembly factor BamB
VIRPAPLWCMAVLAGLLLTGCAGTDNAPKPVALPAFEPGLTIKPLWEADSLSTQPDYQPVLTSTAVWTVHAGQQWQALSLDKGRAVTTLSLPASPVVSPVLADEQVFLGTIKGDVLALDMTGQIRWRAKVSSEVVASPLVAGHLVLVRSGDGRLFALDKLTGARQWMYQKTLPNLILRQSPNLTVEGGTAYLGLPGGRLVALDLQTGVTQWETLFAQPKGATELERISDVTSTPVLTGDTVCAATYQGRVGCVLRKSGAPVWSRPFSSAVTIAVDDDRLYAVDQFSVIHAYARDSGQLQWRNDQLYARRLTAPVRWSNHLAVADYAGYLHVLDPASGKLTGRAATDGAPVRSPPVAADPHIIVQTTAGRAFAFTLN